DVGVTNQIVKNCKVFYLLGVQRNAALVPVIGLIMRAVQTALKGAEGIATARHFNFNDISTQIRQQHTGGWASNERALFDNGNAFEYLCHNVEPFIILVIVS